MSWVWVLVSFGLLAAACIWSERRAERDRQFIVEQLSRLAEHLDTTPTTKAAPASARHRGGNHPTEGDKPDGNTQRNGRTTTSGGTQVRRRRR